VGGDPRFSNRRYYRPPAAPSALAANPSGRHKSEMLVDPVAGSVSAQGSYAAAPAGFCVSRPERGQRGIAARGRPPRRRHIDQAWSTGAPCCRRLSQRSELRSPRTSGKHGTSVSQVNGERRGCR